MNYKSISILYNNNNNVTKDDFSDSKLTFSGNFVIIEESMGDYNSLHVFNLSDVNKIRTYNKLKEEL